ncbi:hypothetical protein KKA47_02415, partial [bacterium]|nr:hypothetical protein [bacterium]
VLALLSRGIDIKGATNYLVKFNNCLAEKFQGKINGQNGENTVTVITFENGEEISLSEFKNQVIQRVFSKAEVYESVATFIELGLTGEMALELFATILDAYLKDRAAATIDMYFFTHLTSKYFVELHEGKYGLQNSRSLVKALAEKGFNTEQIFRVMRGTAENSLCAVFHVYEKLPKLITTLLEGGEIDAEGVADILAHTGGSAAITVDLETVYEALPSLVKLSFKWLIKDGYSYSGAMDVIGNMVRHAKTFYTEKTETGEQVWNVWRLAQSYSSSFPSAFASGGSGPPTWNPDSFYANVLISWLEKPNGFYLLKDGVPLMKDEQAVRANPSRFTQILKKLPPYSQLAFMRYLKLRFPEEELTLEKAETARLKFQKTIDDYKGKIVTDADTEFILFANGEERFNLQLAKEFFLTFGGKNENIVAEGLKGPEAKDQILELVAGEPGRSNGTRRTFIMYLGHGDKEYLSLGQGDPVSASKEKTRIDFAEFGEALLSRSTVYSGDLSSVIIYTDACYSYNFIRNLENFLRGKGVKTLPIVITSSNLDSLGTGGSSEMDSVYLSMILRKFAGKVRALRLLHFLETDVDPSVKTVEDPTIFVPDPDKPDRYIEIG